MSQQTDRRSHAELVEAAATWMGQRRWKEVIALLDGELAERGHPPDLSALLAESYRATGQAEAASETLSRALEETLDPRLQVLLGKIHRDLGEHARALACYQAALDLDHAFHPAWCQYGLVAEHLGQREEANAAFSKALELAPENGLYLLCAAKGELATRGPSSAAEALMTRARKSLSAAGVEGAYNLACLESISGNPEVAWEHFLRFLRVHPHALEWAIQDSDLERMRGLDEFQARVRTRVSGVSPTDADDRPQT